MRHFSTTEQTALEQVDSTKILVTSCIGEFTQKAQNHPFAILRRDNLRAEKIREAFGNLISQNEDLFIEGWMNIDGIPELNYEFNDQTQAAKTELEAMMSAHYALHGDIAMKIELYRTLKKGPHTHSFGVLNSTWNARGPRVKTSNVVVSAREGDWSYINNHVSHESSNDENDEKMSVVIL